MAGTNPKIFTAAEANRTLPLVSVIAKDAMTTWKKLQATKRELRKTSARQPRMDAEGSNKRLSNDQASLERELEEHRLELEELGVYLRDPEKGLVDFPAFLGSELVYLCWFPGEEAVTHYHGMREGFVGRKPLPGNAPSSTS